jgi:DNA polymerase-1
MRYILDLETDGLLQECTRIYCVSLRDVDSDFERLYKPEEIPEFIELLKTNRNNGTEYIGHNIFGFDLMVIKKLYGLDLIGTNKIHDTFIMSQVLFGDLKDKDFKRDNFPKDCIGSDSLKAWGLRLGCYKGDYTGGFEYYNNEMGKYCSQDTLVTKTLFNYLNEQISERTWK